MIRVVKIGGNVVDNPEALAAFVREFSMMPGPKILVHGGGKEATRLSGALGIKTTMIDGRRVTDEATIDVVTMVYAGLVNKRVVAKLQACGVNAVGLSGADGHVITATRRSPEPVDYGFVGDIATDGVNVGFVEMLLGNGLIPVFCAITYDGDGHLLNCNADSVASAVATAVSEIDDTELIYCFEKPGVLADAGDDHSVIPHITPELYQTLKQTGVVSGGMIPKIDNAFKSISNGVKRVVIKEASALNNETQCTVMSL